jgi:hypothetical protein
MSPGDKVVPFLLKWRVGPVGRIRTLRVRDEEWAPTVREGEYSLNPDEPELGRRIEVEWESEGMPPLGKVAALPSEKRGKKPLARHTVEELPQAQFLDLVGVLRNPQAWVDLWAEQQPLGPMPPRSTEDRSLSLVERDLQKLLARNLNLVEPGLGPSPEYQLEEFITDVGRLDLFCVDRDGTFVVVELKAGLAGADAIGQISGYMSWVRENLSGGESVRGILVCGDATARVRAAAKMIATLKIKRYRMSFDFEDLV